MDERELLLREIEATESLLRLYARLRGLSPSPAPAPSARTAGPPQPKGEVVARIQVPVVQGPGGAVAPVVDLSSVAHLVQGGPDALRDLERSIADVIAQIPPDAQPGSQGTVRLR